MNPSLLTVQWAGLALGLLMWGTPAIADSADAAKGKTVYEKHCLVCHGPEGKGDGPAGRMLKPPAADFTSAASKKKSKADFMQIVETGKSGTAMGPWKSQLSQPELNDLIEYVMTLRK